MRADIKKSIRLLAGRDKILASRAKVLSVNDDRTCTVKLISTDLEIPDVRIQAVPGLSAGFYIKPAVNSDVVLLWLDGVTPSIVITGEVESIALRGDELGGLVKAGELKTQLDKATARIDGIIDALTNGVTVPQDGGANYKATIIVKLQTLIDKEDYSDLENDKITHS